MNAHPREGDDCRLRHSFFLTRGRAIINYSFVSFQQQQPQSSPTNHDIQGGCAVYSKYTFAKLHTKTTNGIHHTGNNVTVK